jgi:biopolymer transport protein ExbB/TolQ
MNTSPSRHLIGWSLLWGTLLTVMFYGAIRLGLITNSLAIQYTTAHPIENIEVGLFMVGFAFVIVKYFDLLGQRNVLTKGIILPKRDLVKIPVTQCEQLSATVNEHIKKNGITIHASRLASLLEYLNRGGDPEMLDIEMRYLSDEDVNSADDDYGFVRTILWAVPMLGFLGTVVGITMALSNLDLNAINESSQALSAGLSVAFDTTALGIGLDLFLYFCQFLVHRSEMTLLKEIDHITESEIRGRFVVEKEVTDGQRGELAVVRKMLTDVLETLESLMKTQSEVWDTTITSVNERTARIASDAATLVQKSLTKALSENVKLHAAELGKLEASLHTSLRNDNERHNDQLNGNTEMLLRLQEAITQQAETSKSVVDATLQLTNLENTLNSNLRSVSQVGNFEDTINSLAAAIHLLNVRLQTPTPSSVNLCHDTTAVAEKGFAA